LLILIIVVVVVLYRRSKKRRISNQNTELESKNPDNNLYVNPSKIIEDNNNSQYNAIPSLIGLIRTRIGDFFVLDGVLRDKKIGSGNFGDVYLGSWMERKVALKTLKEDNTDSQSFLSEIELALKLHHPSVVGCFGVTQIGKDIYSVLEYCAKGSLLDYLTANGMKISSKVNILLTFICLFVFHFLASTLQVSDLLELVKQAAVSLCVCRS